MIKMLELREVIKLVNQSSIDELKLTNRGVRISMKKPLPVIPEPMVIEDPETVIKTAINEAAVALDVSPPESNSAAPGLKGEIEESKIRPIVSPVVGVFSSSPAPYVKVGDKITANSIVCSCNVEALKLFHEIKSNVSGEIVEILVDDGQLVEYGQPLFLVKPEYGRNG